jgi:transcription antitermination factor NusG
MVARTQAHRERWAAENVTRLGAEYYLPQTLETERFVQAGKRRREFRVRPLFPTYLFVRPAHGQWHAILSAFGIVGMVPGSGGYPAFIRDISLSTIRLLEENGLVVLPKEGGLRPGSPARITRGAYAGFAGLVQGISANDRIHILLDYMGRKVPFLVRPADLEAVA